MEQYGIAFVENLASPDFLSCQLPIDTILLPEEEKRVECPENQGM
jgi:hypothetical protein